MDDLHIAPDINHPVPKELTGQMCVFAHILCEVVAE